ncbi:MAG: class I SAM-dependent methyltransferase [Chitinophagaceae bacterium]
MTNSTTEMTVNNTTWFKHWFDSSFYHQLYAHRNEKEAANFIDELVAELKPLRNSIMLDLGCGAGRHAKYLASKGFRVKGIDLAFSSIQMAKRYETFNLQFQQQDMRAPFGHNRFDYVFNFFTSFGYFKDEEDNHKVISNIFNGLKPGGILVMDYINVAWSEKKLIPSEEKEIDGITYHLTRWTDNKNFYKKIIIDDVQAEGSFEYTEQVAKLTLPDFENLFSCHGLRLQKVYGDYQLNNYRESESPRLILVAKKDLT